MTKSYSIAEARDQLPRLVHEAEEGTPIELTRRGKPVAVLVSLEDYRRMKGRKVDFGEALTRFLERYDPVAAGVTGEEFDGLRDLSPGRDFSW